MTINVKYLSEQQIERDAQALLAAYFHELGKPVQIPVPAEDILELHLGLSLDFDDLQSVLGIPDVLGALWADKREVFIDQSMEPTEHPDMEGRYHFSVGPEIGHWRLHRQYLTNAGTQVAMFTDSDPQPTVICRTSQKKQPIEWQADYFSSCFLMPRQCVLDAWSDRFGSLKPLVYADIAEQSWARRAPSRSPWPLPVAPAGISIGSTSHLGHCAVGEPEAIAGLWDTDRRGCARWLPLAENTGDEGHGD